MNIANHLRLKFNSIFISTNMAYENNPLHLNQTEHKFEMTLDNSKAFIAYEQIGKKIRLIHTKVPAQLEGKGVASALVEKTLRYIDEHNYQFVPQCAFIQSYLQKHPEWNRLAAESE